MRRREVIVHQPMGAMTGQVIAPTKHPDSVYSVPLSVFVKGSWQFA